MIELIIIHPVTADYQRTERCVLENDAAEDLADLLGCNGWWVETEIYRPLPARQTTLWGPVRVYEADPNPPKWRTG